MPKETESCTWPENNLKSVKLRLPTIAKNSKRTTRINQISNSQLLLNPSNFIFKHLHQYYFLEKLNSKFSSNQNFSFRLINNRADEFGKFAFDQILV